LEMAVDILTAVAATTSLSEAEQKERKMLFWSQAHMISFSRLFVSTESYLSVYVYFKTWSPQCAQIDRPTSAIYISWRTIVFLFYWHKGIFSSSRIWTVAIWIGLNMPKRVKA
jgi:hypothetical protein